MQSTSRNHAISSLVFPATALLLAWGCSSAGGNSSTAGAGTTGEGGSLAGGATSGPGSASAAAGNPGSGGTTAKAGSSSTSAVAGSGGGGASGGTTGGGGSAKAGTTSGTTAKAGTTSGGTTTNTGGTTTKGGTTSTGTTTSSGGAPAKDAGAGVDGPKSTGSVGDGGGSCPTTMPEGGVTKTGKSVNGTSNGLGYGIWTDGDGGSITVYDNAHAFSTSWSESKDFLAHLGLDFRPGKDWTTLGTIAAEYSEVKSGTSGSFSMIGVYGWTQSPCVEWYINEDSWRGMSGGSGTAVDIDGGTYYIRTLQTNGTGGANACESGHTGTWTQMISNRKTARTCGTVTVSQHFKEWENQGWKLGALTMVHINVEVGGGTGKIDFPLANVTTTNK